MTPTFLFLALTFLLSLKRIHEDFHLYLIFQLYHCQKEFLSSTPKHNIPTLVPSLFQKMVKNLGVCLTLFFVPRSTSNLSTVPSKSVLNLSKPPSLPPPTFASIHKSLSDLFKTYIRYIIHCSKLAYGLIAHLGDTRTLSPVLIGSQ